MPRLLIIFACLFFSTVNLLAQDWQAQFDKLIQLEPSLERNSLIDSISLARPAWQDVTAKIKTISFPDTTIGVAVRRYNPCIDSESRPYVLYIPSSYNPNKPIPMIVVLHDSVTNPNIIPDPLEWAENSEYVTLAEQKGWFALFPTGQAGATWWDNVGMANITSLVRRMKSRFNIDDNRIYLGGFSDGGSAGFLFAMIMPSDFAAFFALNGQMGIGSEKGNLPTYATNLSNSPVFMTTTDNDLIYAPSQMKRAIALAEKAGAKIFYQQLNGGHDFNDVKTLLPQVFDYLEQHPRNPIIDKITWESAVKDYGICRWIAIDEVTVDDPAPWYVDYNVALVDSLITFGIVPSDTFSGYGFMIGRVVSGGYAERLGLQSGDIITKINDQNISNYHDLINFESTLKHGERVVIPFKRSINELAMISRVPPPRNYLLFKREFPSAVVKATDRNNHFRIQGSRVGAFRILIDPNMIDLNKNVVVQFNGKTIFNNMVTPDIDYLLKDYLTNRDRKTVFVNEILLNITN